MNFVRLQKKIPLFLIIPLVVLLAFSIYSSFTKYEENKIYTNTNKYIHFSIISSSLIHELQKERGYSSGYIGSSGKSFKEDLIKQRKKTDVKILKLQEFLKDFDSKIYEFPFDAQMKNFLNSVKDIEKYRKKVDMLHADNVMEYYTNDINILLNLIEHIVTISNDSKLIILTQSYTLMMQIKENAGKERALINSVLSRGKLSNEDLYQFGVLVTAQKIYIQDFRDIALKDEVKLLDEVLAQKYFLEVKKTRNNIYLKSKKNEILSEIKEYVGYGGLIHNFKNYVIRGKTYYEKAVRKQYKQLLKAISEYKSLKNITPQEIKRLDIIQGVFLEYLNGLEEITKSYQMGGSIHALDKIVKVDDRPAIKALHELSTNLYGSEVAWFKQSTNRINALKKLEDKIADDLHKYIEEKNSFLVMQLIIKILIMLIVMLIIILSINVLRELLESRKMLNRAQKNTHSGSYEYFFEKDMLYWSDEHYTLLQLDKKEFNPTKESFKDFIHPEDLWSVIQAKEKAISTKKISFVEYRLILPDKSMIYVRSSLEVIRYSKRGKPLLMVGTITDITQSKKLEQEIIDTQKDVIFTMGAIGESRSKETGKHVKRVAEYSRLLYLLSGATKEEAELLKMASPMHDIGKVGIPDKILNKPAKLDPTEWAIMKTHAEMGYEMLKNSHREILQLAATVALTHHERYDGEGYPKGLVGESIPIVGRITALADVFDALGSDRCYKVAWKLEDIIKLIKEQRAKQFDPQLVDLFLDNLDEFLKIRDRYKDIIE